MDFDTVKTFALWALIIIAAVGILLAIVVKAIIGKVISLALAAILVFFCWQQRDKVLDAGDTLKAHACSSADSEMPTFFGIEVSAPDDWCETTS